MFGPKMCSRCGRLAFRVGGVEFETSLHGTARVLNLLAGIAVAGIYRNRAGATCGKRCARLRRAKCAGARLNHNGILILNDCYNSNPDAVRAMLDVLRDTPARAADRRSGGDARTRPLG